MYDQCDESDSFSLSIVRLWTLIVPVIPRHAFTHWTVVSSTEGEGPQAISRVYQLRRERGEKRIDKLISCRLLLVKRGTLILVCLLSQFSRFYCPRRSSRGQSLSTPSSPGYLVRRRERCSYYFLVCASPCRVWVAYICVLWSHGCI